MKHSSHLPLIPGQSNTLSTTTMTSRLALLAALRRPPPPSSSAPRMASSSPTSCAAAASRSRSSSASSSSRPPPLPLRSATILHHRLRLPPDDGLAARSRPSSTSSVASPSTSLRRRRRRDAGGGTRAVVGGEATDDDDGDDDAVRSPASAGFAPRDPATGIPLDAQSYLALASLSPWVPCPDVVVRRALEIADLGTRDVHADLGCGDGRLCFAASDPPFAAMASWGVDVDPNILARCRERTGRRFVPPGGGGGGSPSSWSSSGDAGGGRGDGPEFLLADLVAVVDGERARYRRRLLSSNGDVDDGGDPPPPSDGRDEDVGRDDVTMRLSRSTVVTAYFVDGALRTLRPYLARVLGGRDGVRVVTVGYEMGGGWEPSWVESVLGLTIFRYDMVGVSNEPAEWGAGDDGDDGKGGEEDDGGEDGVGVGGGGVGDDGSPEFAEFLARKRARDAEELDAGLRIHHDERLDEFAGARRSTAAGGGVSAGEEEGAEDWDFDETEEPGALMKEVARGGAATGTSGPDGVRGGRGDAGSDDAAGMRGRKMEVSGTKAGTMPVWKKP